MNLSDPHLATLVDRFYARVRDDGLIGPVFNDAVDDWPAHLDKLTRFWSAVTLGTGRYKGSPMAAHLKHVRAITPEMFARWLALWKEITDEMMEPEAAAELQAKAARIGENLQSVIHFRPAGEAPPAPPPGPRRSHAPYRSTAIFDQDSLPAALRREHRTRAGTWGAIHVLDGALRLHFTEPPAVQHLDRDRPGVIAPEQTHWVEPLGAMRMRIDFHDAPPVL